MTTDQDRPGDSANSGRRRSARSERAILKTVAFDSAGPRKYALQVQRAGNGNPCLKIVEGIPNDDGSHRKIYLTIWSEDFEMFFESLDQMRAFISDEGITTPSDHKTPTTIGRSRKRTTSKQEVPPEG